MSFFKSRQHDNTDVSALPWLWILQIKSKEKKMISLEHQYHTSCNPNRAKKCWNKLIENLLSYLYDFDIQLNSLLSIKCQ